MLEPRLHLEQLRKLGIRLVQLLVQPRRADEDHLHVDGDLREQQLLHRPPEVRLIVLRRDELLGEQAGLELLVAAVLDEGRGGQDEKAAVGLV